MALANPIDDATLLCKLRQSLSDEHESLATFLGLLGEVEVRRIFADAGHASMFAFCTDDLRLKAAEAYSRIQASRLARRFPTIIDRIACGQLSLSSIKFIAPHLTDDDFTSILDAIVGKTTREVEKYARELEAKKIRALMPPVACEAPPSFPDEPVTPSLDEPKLVDGQNGTPFSPKHVMTAEELARLGASQRPDRTRYVTPERVEIRFTAHDSLLKKLERVKGIAMRKGVANRLEQVIDHMIEIYLDKFDPERWEKRKARTAKQEGRERTRYVPQPVKREVYTRDEGRCTFVGPDGKRCRCTVGLEYDHIVPYSLGGSSTDVDNIRLRCRAHNRLAAEQVFGKDHVEAKIQQHQNRAN